MSSPESYIAHPLNISPTKQAHTFSKQPRFQRHKRLVTQAVYNMPSTFSKRSTSFGIGQKCFFVDRNQRQLPPPGSYRVSSQFQRKHFENVTSIGVGRDQVSFGSFLIQALKRNKYNPSPDKYNVPVERSSIGGRMAQRITTDPDLRYKKSIPGPGAYQMTSTEIAKNGAYVLSNYKYPQFLLLEVSARRDIAALCRLTTKRKMTQTDLSGVYYVGYVDDVDEKEKGKYCSSKYKNIAVRSFGKAKREGLEDRSKLNLPNPKYKRFSQFGSFI